MTATPGRTVSVSLRDGEAAIRAKAAATTNPAYRRRMGVETWKRLLAEEAARV